MALIAQNNDGMITANTYATEQELISYADDRDIVLTANPSVLLLKAMDVLQAKQYKGEPFNDLQPTKFPIKGLGVPLDIKQAQILLAVAFDSTDLLAATTDAKIKAEKVDVISVEYFASEDNTQSSPLLTAVNELLSPYLAGASGLGLNVRVFRG